MNKANQEEIFIQRKQEVAEIIDHVVKEKEDLEAKTNNPKEALANLFKSNQQIGYYLFNQSIARLHNIKFSEKSPFFTRLTVQFDDKNNSEKIYIGKFSFLSDKIYSWTAPVASLRYNTPGDFSYVRPNGEMRSGRLIDREDYFISNGKIVSLYDVTSFGRELVYDEYISVKRTGFGLSDIVRELERAQNEIIVLDPRGAMVVSGPAGSGKTTLALHRVAYLLQNPDTSEIYKPENSIIFIQDQSSIEYFSSLFVNLGVEGVKFTTFENWCAEVLGISQEYTYVDRYGNKSLEQDWYEWNKVKITKDIESIKFGSDPWKTLDMIYNKCPDSKFKEIWANQKREKFLDKQDITALLKVQVQSTKGKIHQSKRVWKKKDGKQVPIMARTEVVFDTVLVDEFENYTSDQINLISSTLSSKASCLFVGDINQQTRFGSISDFSQSSINIPENRNIVLNKVYRNSAAVLKLLGSLGYRVNIDNKNSVEGSGDWFNYSLIEAESHIKEYLEKNKDEQVGIVCYDADKAEQFKELFKLHAGHIHIGTVKEFQGLEFDTVFILDVNKELFTPSGLDSDFDQERSKILREQLYVAITRARNSVMVYSDSDSDRGGIKSFIN